MPPIVTFSLGIISAIMWILLPKAAVKLSIRALRPSSARYLADLRQGLTRTRGQKGRLRSKIRRLQFPHSSRHGSIPSDKRRSGKLQGSINRATTVVYIYFKCFLLSSDRGVFLVIFCNVLRLSKNFQKSRKIIENYRELPKNDWQIAEYDKFIVDFFGVIC